MPVLANRLVFNFEYVKGLDTFVIYQCFRSNFRFFVGKKSVVACLTLDQWKIYFSKTVFKPSGNKRSIICVYFDP